MIEVEFRFFFRAHRMDEEDAAGGGRDRMAAMRAGDEAPELGRVPAEFIDLERAKATGADATLETHGLAVIREGRRMPARILGLTGG
jgi:hypothetical protein